MLVWNYGCKSYYAAYNENMVNKNNDFKLRNLKATYKFTNIFQNVSGFININT